MAGGALSIPVHADTPFHSGQVECPAQALLLPYAPACHLPHPLLPIPMLQVLEVEVMGGSPFGAGSWAFGGRAARAAAASAVVRMLIGDPWQSGARVQLEFPYQPK